MQHWFLLASVALIFFGITGITRKLSTNSISFGLSFVWFTIAFVVISIVVAATMPMDWRLSTPAALLAAVGGLPNGPGALTSFAALEKGGKASVVIPIITLYPLVTIAGARIYFGECLTHLQVAGTACALVAVTLLAQESETLSGVKGA